MTAAKENLESKIIRLKGLGGFTMVLDCPNHPGKKKFENEILSCAVCGFVICENDRIKTGVKVTFETN